jgi:hypothetical protein
MQGWGRTREIPLLTSDPVLAYSSGEPRGIRYAFEVRYASDRRDEADIASGPSRAKSRPQQRPEPRSALPSIADITGICGRGQLRAKLRHERPVVLIQASPPAGALGHIFR